MKHAGTAQLGLGTATFIPGYGLPGSSGGQCDEALLRAALRRGVRYVDTAASYGTSESVLGALAEELASLEVRVCTKVSVAGNDGANELLAAADASLRRLRCANVDTLMLHSADEGTLRRTDLAEAMRQVVSRGLAGKAGASSYGVEAARLGVAAPWCQALQVEYSILNQSVYRAIRATPGVGAEIIARSVLCKGLLTDRPHAAPAVGADLADTLDQLERLAAEWGYSSLSQLAIRFALDSPGIDVVVVGVSGLDELESAVEAYDRAALSPTQMQVLVPFDRSDLDVVHPERWPDALSPAGRR